ncbi:PREDICTED: fractalkine [Elephantulus edwardii]|uniref:fractalkine n=1 Tax=Elephantulus edwardii TaxID=28737 RepID=UPI0003F06681|nr:PREDICTED: fractalkine [Elephantulus edwardii]
MTSSPCSWLLLLVALCHLTIPLAGQHHAVNKCPVVCNKMTSRIMLAKLISYERNRPSCGRPAIILRTKQHRVFCADPAEKWVQEVMEQLDRRATALTPNSGKFEKQIGVGEPRTTPGTEGTDQHAVTEPRATGESGVELTSPSQEAQRALGTSPELPTGVAVSSETRSPSASKTEDAGPPAGPGGTEVFNVATVSTMISTMITWPSSATYQAGPGLWAPSTEAPSTEVPSTEAPSTKAPIISHSATEDHMGPEGDKGRSLEPENSPESVPVHTDAFLDWGPGSLAHASVNPLSFEGALSRESGAEGSWAPKATEAIHATRDPQSLSVFITPVPDAQAATRRQAVGLLAFLGLLFCLGVVMFTYQSFQGCSRKVAGEMVEGLRYVPRSCGTNSYVLVPV